jgi:hypothetical protein
MPRYSNISNIVVLSCRRLNIITTTTDASPPLSTPRYRQLEIDAVELVGSPERSQAHTGGLGLFFLKKIYIHRRGALRRGGGRGCCPCCYCFSSSSLAAEQEETAGSEKEISSSVRVRFLLFLARAHATWQSLVLALVYSRADPPACPPSWAQRRCLSPSLYSRCGAVALHPCCPPFLPW